MSAESRSSPRVNWVMSFEPIEKPSKCSRNRSARIALAGSSHIITTLSPFSPRRRPFCASNSTTAVASPTVRTNGTMIWTFVSPISSRTRRSASHSMSKHARNSGETYRAAPRYPSIGFSSSGS